MSALADVPGIRVGHAQDRDAATGCTVVLGPFRVACDVRGHATATRELEAISPLHLVERADAILLTGGSAFGLAAADGVVAWLEENGRGFDTGAARVPIVPAAAIYDLAVGRADRRPDAAMGRAACESALRGDAAQGRVGAGAGATVGKLLGPQGAMPGGVGSASLSAGAWRVGALAVVNALGDVLDTQRRVLAGARRPDGSFLDSESALRAGALPAEFPQAATNTTLCVIATDAPLHRMSLLALARMAGVALPRRIAPVYTPFDGDVCFAASTAADACDVAPGELLALAVAAAAALERAIERAVTHTPTDE